MLVIRDSLRAYRLWILMLDTPNMNHLEVAVIILLPHPAVETPLGKNIRLLVIYWFLLIIVWWSRCAVVFWPKIDWFYLYLCHLGINIVLYYWCKTSMEKSGRRSRRIHCVCADSIHFKLIVYHHQLCGCGIW